MEKELLTPDESLNIINKAISNFKVNYRESAQIFLLWGWTMSLASFSNFIILQVLQSKEAYNQMGLFSLGNWTVFVFGTFIIQYFMHRKINEDKKVFSHLDNSIRIVWMVTGASMFVATFLCFKLGIIPPTILLLLTGIGTTITGLLIKFKPLIIGGIAFFLFCIATTFVADEYIALLTGVSIICGYLIPGYLLKSAKE